MSMSEGDLVCACVYLYGSCVYIYYNFLIMSEAEVCVKEEPKDAAMSKKKDAAWSMIAKQLAASVFFGLSSILIITTNKTVLTVYKYVSARLRALDSI